MNTKVCTNPKCRKELPATTEFFHRQKTGKFGFRSECKECRKKSDKKTNNPANTDASIKQVCSGECGEELPATLDYFHPSGFGKYGVRGMCKVCRNKDSVEYGRTPRGRANILNRIAIRRLQKNTQTQFFWTPNESLIRNIYQFCPKGYEVDHMIPLSKGGDHHESNLCYLPKSVNCSKYNKSIEEFGIGTFNKNVIYWQDLFMLQTNKICH